MQPLIIKHIEVASFKIPFVQSFVVAGQKINERTGFYLSLKTEDGSMAQGEIAPLEGVSLETIRRTKHDIKETRAYLKEFKIPCRCDQLLDTLRHDPHILNVCASVRFGIESAILTLASMAASSSLAEFLGATLRDVQTAALLQGPHQQVMADFKRLSQQGVKVFKLKVGDRNIALDVKKIQDIRILLEHNSYLRLDGNRGWSLKEACIFAELAGNQNIDFIEEPLNDLTQLDAFYQKTHMRVALDETLSIVRCGIRAPARCASPLAGHDGVVAYVLKPMMLGIIPTLDWIEEANFLKRKAVISSAFESQVGLKVLANLACLSGQIAGLGTERWFKNDHPLVNAEGIINKDLLI